MKKALLFLLLIFSLIGCKKVSFQGKIDMLNLDISYFSYSEQICIINDYNELKDKVSNYDSLKELNEEFFLNYDLLCILVPSNAEEYHNKIECKKIEYNDITKKYEFSFAGEIEDESTDLAYFLTSFTFKIQKDLQIKEEHIHINKETIIRKNR